MQSAFIPQSSPFACWQLPIPSHWFGAAQVPGSGWPFATFEQVPSIPATLHALHVPVQPALQQ